MGDGYSTLWQFARLGRIALLRNDSLYRLGSTQDYEYYKLAEGPVRSVFELRYKGWMIEGDTLEAVERISIYPGNTGLNRMLL